MIKSDNYRFGIPQYIIYPGDYCVTDERSFLNTVVGASVVVCLHDPVRKIGGMGHFIVPGTAGTENVFAKEIADFGVMQMENLVEAFEKKDGERKNLVSKIFGAGYAADSKAPVDVIRTNVKYIFDYLNAEKIKIVTEDIGGEYRRNILFRPVSGEVNMRILMNNEHASEFIKLEKEYIEKSIANHKNETNVISLK